MSDSWREYALSLACPAIAQSLSEAESEHDILRLAEESQNPVK